jgi:transaldolase
MRAAMEFVRMHPNVKMIWASPRELLNIFQADDTGCHIITLTNDILQKLPLIGKDLNSFSMETVEMFYRDALKSGYTLEPPDTPNAEALPLTAKNRPGAEPTAFHGPVDHDQ